MNLKSPDAGFKGSECTKQEKEEGLSLQHRRAGDADGDRYKNAKLSSSSSAGWSGADSSFHLEGSIEGNLRVDNNVPAEGSSLHPEGRFPMAGLYSKGKIMEHSNRFSSQPFYSSYSWRPVVLGECVAKYQEFSSIHSSQPVRLGFSFFGILARDEGERGNMLSELLLSRYQNS